MADEQEVFDQYLKKAFELFDQRYWNDNAHKGLAIIIEGIDGSGKTTLVNHLNDWFKRFDYDSEIIHLPTKNFVAHENQVLNAMRLRLDQLEVVYERMIKDVIPNKILIFDRFLDSFSVYNVSPAVIEADEVDATALLGLNSVNLIKGYDVPNFHFLLDLDPEVAVKRLQAHQKETTQQYQRDIDNEPIEMHSQRSFYYRQLWLRKIAEPEGNEYFCILNLKNEPTVDTLAFSILASISTLNLRNQNQN